MKRILIVDDEEIIRNMLKVNLERKEFECLVAENGRDAIRIAKENKPNLIILDLILPKLSGEEVCKEIRSDEETKNIPIIILTAKDTYANKTAGIDIGANYYLTKPCTIEQLLDKIYKVLGK